MKCPIDNTDLQMTERQDVEIDYCPKCRGVWLDRGELDKIIERGTSSIPEDNGRGEKREGREERGGFFGELFDF